MDPNNTLQDIRVIGKELVRSGCHDPDATEDLICLIEALDEWITKGGFLPDEWAVTPGND